MRRRAKLIKHLDNEMDDEFFFGDILRTPFDQEIPEIDERGYEEEEDEDRQPEMMFV